LVGVCSTVGLGYAVLRKYKLGKLSLPLGVGIVVLSSSVLGITEYFSFTKCKEASDKKKKE
jgi:hypothetical protein